MSEYKYILESRKRGYVDAEFDELKKITGLNGNNISGHYEKNSFYYYVFTGNEFGKNTESKLKELFKLRKLKI